MKLKRLVTLTLGVTFHTLASANVYITELHFGSANQEDNIIIANDFIEICNFADTAADFNK